MRKERAMECQFISSFYFPTEQRSWRNLTNQFFCPEMESSSKLEEDIFQDPSWVDAFGIWTPLIASTCQQFLIKTSKRVKIENQLGRLAHF